MSMQSLGLKCRSRLVAATVAIVACALSDAGVSHATATRIPAIYYPAGASVSYLPTVSNRQMDCLWGFFCEGPIPLFHFSLQDQLQRVSGWGQFAGLRRHGRMWVSFELFASRYQDGTDLDGTPFSKEAFDDLIHAIRAHGYTRLSRQSHFLPLTAGGGSIAEAHRLGSSELVIMACWGGTEEVEAITMVNDGSASIRRMAVHDLTLQVLRAAGAREKGS